MGFDEIARRLQRLADEKNLPGDTPVRIETVRQDAAEAVLIFSHRGEKTVVVRTTKSMPKKRYLVENFLDNLLIN